MHWVLTELQPSNAPEVGTMKKKTGEKRRHVVAWSNKAEWDQVREHLYSREADLQRFALHRISAWKCRYASNTPVAMDCTADLVRCQVQDRCGQLDGPDLVLMYGAALVRFVNLITERQQGKVARPLRRLAGNLNIPEWLVDLRHDFTHRKLPTLKWCRKGSEVALEWLRQEYWSRQLGGPGDVWDHHSDVEDEGMELRRQEDELMAKHREMEAYRKARELLVAYDKEQVQVCGSQDDLSAWPPPFADMSWILGEIKQFSLESSDVLIDVLLEDGFLVPTVEQLESLDCDTRGDDARPTEPRLPPKVCRFWLPLLKTLNSQTFIHLFLEKLFGELKVLCSEPSKHRAFFISAWISEVLYCNSNKSEYCFETKAQKKARVKDRIFVHRIQLRWQQLLSACLDSPCVSTPHLLQLILGDMEHPLPLDNQQKLLQLCTIYTQTEHLECDGPPERKQPIYTLESLLEKLQHSRKRKDPPVVKADGSRSAQEDRWSDVQARKAELLRGSPWQLCSDSLMWKNCPLGKVPGQSDDPSCLMVDTYSTMTVEPVELETVPVADVPVGSGGRRVDGLRWSQNELHKIKSGLQLF